MQKSEISKKKKVKLQKTEINNKENSPKCGRVIYGIM